VLQLRDLGTLRREKILFFRTTLAQEITTFVMNYLSLTDVERKALKDATHAHDHNDNDVGVKSCDVAKCARQWLANKKGGGARQLIGQLGGLTAADGSTTVRYGGGAKERAKEREAQGLELTSDEKNVLKGIACAWCSAELPSTSLTQGCVSSTYCSQNCAEEGRLHRGTSNSSFIRAQMFALQSGVCRRCHIDAHALFLRIKALAPAERLNALMAIPQWKLPQTSNALNNVLQNPRECDFWEIDHIRAVAEGGGDCGLDNLRTLCVPCHKVETEKLRNRLPVVQAAAAFFAAKGTRTANIRDTLKSATRGSSTTRTTSPLSSIIGTSRGDGTITTAPNDSNNAAASDVGKTTNAAAAASSSIGKKQKQQMDIRTSFFQAAMRPKKKSKSSTFNYRL
jgi:hypothetical protein